MNSTCLIVILRSYKEQVANSANPLEIVVFALFLCGMAIIFWCAPRSSQYMLWYWFCYH
jgi:hypothetical protein